MQAVWNVFTSAPVKNAAMPVNLEVFRDAWAAFPQPDITAFLSARSIDYSADSYEADNSANALSKAALGLGEYHTLYGSSDIDYIAFDATAGRQYTARTTLLRNGADTVIRIIAPNQTTVRINDNTNGANYAVFPFVPNNCDIWGECHENGFDINGFDILGSTASFTATATGIYYVEVKSSPNRPFSAGRYGSYTLTITSSP